MIRPVHINATARANKSQVLHCVPTNQHYITQAWLVRFFTVPFMVLSSRRRSVSSGESACAALCETNALRLPGLTITFCTLVVSPAEHLRRPGTPARAFQRKLGD